MLIVDKGEWPPNWVPGMMSWQATLNWIHLAMILSSTLPVHSASCMGLKEEASELSFLLGLLATVVSKDLKGDG